jgi:hypothetical protein
MVSQLYSDSANALDNSRQEQDTSFFLTGGESAVSSQLKSTTTKFKNAGGRRYKSNS